jgi:hypothetical protein
MNAIISRHVETHDETEVTEIEHRKLDDRLDRLLTQNKHVFEYKWADKVCTGYVQYSAIICLYEEEDTFTHTHLLLNICVYCCSLFIRSVICDGCLAN